MAEGEVSHKKMLIHQPQVRSIDAGTYHAFLLHLCANNDPQSDSDGHSLSIFLPKQTLWSRPTETLVSGEPVLSVIVNILTTTGVFFFFFWSGDSSVVRASDS